MRIIFVTDIHGDKKKYDKIINTTRNVSASMVINAGDMLLKQGDPFRQGHIHESPEISGKWYAKIGTTYCIQPGQCQSDRLTYVLIDTEKMTLNYQGLYNDTLGIK